MSGKTDGGGASGGSISLYWKMQMLVYISPRNPPLFPGGGMEPSLCSSSMGELAGMTFKCLSFFEEATHNTSLFLSRCR